MFAFSQRPAYKPVPSTPLSEEVCSEENITHGRLRLRRGQAFIPSFVVVLVAAITLFGLGRFTGYHEANRLASSSIQRPTLAVSDSWPSAQTATPLPVQPRCTGVSFRREWRTLAREEKAAYVGAVRCLAHKPSVLSGNGTIYDDFAQVHNRFAHGSRCRFHPSALLTDDMTDLNCVPLLAHGKAAFFAWHRRFIAVYEKYLQDSCDYQGALP
jgi:tyrosinase